MNIVTGILITAGLFCIAAVLGEVCIKVLKKIKRMLDDYDAHL